MIDLNSLLMVEDITDQFDPQEIKESQGLAIATAVPVLFFLPTVLKKDTPYLKFVANQSLTLFLLGLIVCFVGAIIGFIPLLGGIVQFLLGLCTSALAIWHIVDAATGKVRKLPIVGPYIIEAFK